MSLPEIPNDPWFNKPHPHDSMPIARDPNENPRPEEEIAWDLELMKKSIIDAADADTYASRHESTPEFEKTAEEVVTMHEKMYRIATSKYNPFAVGGSESIHDFEGGSENVQK